MISWFASDPNASCVRASSTYVHGIGLEDDFLAIGRGVVTEMLPRR